MVKIDKLQLMKNSFYISLCFGLFSKRAIGLSYYDKVILKKPKSVMKNAGIHPSKCNITEP
jgi:hypothetical protein